MKKFVMTLNFSCLIVRLVPAGFGIGALSHMLTGSVNGWQYFAASGVLAMLYFFAAILEVATDQILRKEKESPPPSAHST